VFSPAASADWVAAESVHPSGQQKPSTHTSVRSATMVTVATALSTQRVYRQRPTALTLDGQGEFAIDFSVDQSACGAR
jgi:hypothetical protein